MTTPRWVETRCHPIALRDVLGYIVGVVKSLVARTFSLQFFVAVKSRLPPSPRMVDKSEISWSLIRKRFGKGDENFSLNLYYTTGLMPFVYGAFLMNYENVEDDGPGGRDRRGNHTGDWSRRSYA